MNTNQLIQAVNDIQQNAQAALPVLPNNGNPQGANNMPAAPQPTQPVRKSAADFYPWLNPSPSVESIRRMLGSYQAPQTPPNNDVPLPPIPTRLF